MFILFTNLFLARPFRLENTLECYKLRGVREGPLKWWLGAITGLYIASTSAHNLMSFAWIHMILVPKFSDSFILSLYVLII